MSAFCREYCHILYLRVPWRVGYFHISVTQVSYLSNKLHNTQSVPGGSVNILGGHSIGHSKQKCVLCTRVLFRTVSEIALFHCKVANLLIKRYHVLFLIPPPSWRCSPMRTMASSFTRFLDHTQRRTTVGRTPLDEWSARRRDIYLTTHNRQTSMAPGGIRKPQSQQASGRRPTP